MAENWIRCKLTAKLLADAHFGTGSGGSGIDSLLARDRYDRPVIWASHVEGVLRDAARRLHDEQTAGNFFGRAAGTRQQALFTSLYASARPESHIWRSAARQSFDNRAPKDDTLRVIEFTPKGTRFEGEVELPESQLPLLQRLIQEVDALGSGRSSGAGRLKLSLENVSLATREVGSSTKKLRILLRNRDPLCITATATPDNLIPSLAFVPGRTLLGALADWLITTDNRDIASLLTSGRILLSDALPLPQASVKLEAVEVIPAPLSLQSEKPQGSAEAVPWWAQPKTGVKRIDALTATEKLKRPEDDLFTCRLGSNEPWISFRPARRVRLRNGRPDPKQADASLFALEQIVEGTHFLVELSGSSEDMECLAQALSPVLKGQRWLRIGRSGTPVEVVQLAWIAQENISQPGSEDLDPNKTFRLTLTADLLVRDEYLRWRTALDVEGLQALLGNNDICLGRSTQDWVPVYGFNGTSRLWRMPAAAIRRGSVFEVSGSGVAELARRAAQGQWLGERTHEGFGRFRLDEVLPGITNDQVASNDVATVKDVAEELIAAETCEWFCTHKTLAQPATGSDRKPSLSQWFDLIADLQHSDTAALPSRLNPQTVGARNWKHADAKSILEKLNAIPEPEDRILYAQLFVRWLRAEMRKKEGA